MHKVTIGVLPTKRGFLSMEVANKQRQEMMSVIEKICPNAIKLVTLDDVCENGIAYRMDDIEKAVNKFKANNIDALFLAHMDFGEESVAAGIAQKLKLPTLLWGARDEYPNSFTARGRDTQCGMFACSKVLARSGITYSYIYNCRVTDPEFASGFENFCRAIGAVKMLKGTSILKIGARPGSFMSVMADEADLLNKFGIVVKSVAPVDIVKRAQKIEAENDPEYEEYYKDLISRIDFSSVEEKQARLNAAVVISIKRAMEQSNAVAGALECWSAFGGLCGLTPCLAIGELSDLGMPLACECDVMGALTLAIIRGVSFDESAPFFADLTIRHPSNDNAELLWHCGPFPYSLKACDQKACMVGSNEHFELKKGDITIIRMDQLNGKYYLFAGDGRACDGPETTGTYVWFETDCWRDWETRLMYGPYIHHVGGIYGKYVRAAKEAARFMGIEFDYPGKPGPELMY